MKFRELRLSKNITQVELSKKLNISNRTISMWEKGSSAPRYYLIPKIAAVLNVSSEEVLNCFIDDEECALAHN